MIAVLIFLAGPVGVWTLQRLVRRDHPGDRRWPSLDRMDEQFGALSGRVVWLTAGLAMAFALLSWLALTTINRWIASLDGPAVIRLYPSPAVWWFFPGFAALSLCLTLSDLMLPAFLGRERARQFLFWTEERDRRRDAQILRWFSVLVTGPILGLTLLALPVHTSFLEDAMVMHDWAEMRQTRMAYSQVTRLALTREAVGRGGRTTVPALEVMFRDGSRWRSRGLLRDPEPQLPVGLVRMLESRTGLLVGK